MELKSIVEKQKESFKTDATKSVEFRINMLQKLEKVIRDNEKQIHFTLDKTEINTMANEKLTAKFKVKDMATLSGNFDLVLRVQSYTTIQPGLKIKVKRTIGSDVKENTFTTVDKLTSSSLLCLAKAVGDDKLLSFEQHKGKEIEHEISFEGIPEDKTYKLKLQVCSFDSLDRKSVV